MDTSKKTDKIQIVDESATPPIELYDDLPPARPATLGKLSGALTALLLNEVNQTLQDVNKALAFLREVEDNAVARKAGNGQVVTTEASQAAEIDLTETLREQLARLQEQARPVWNNLEASLHQYWLTVRERGNQLKATIKQDKAIQPEEYVSEEQPVSQSSSANVRPPTQQLPRQTEVETATAPSRELTLDIFNEPASHEIVVIAEHPGLQPTSIHISLAHDILTLVAIDLNDQVYNQECLLPVPVELDTFTQTYRNGVLEIRLKTRR